MNKDAGISKITTETLRCESKHQLKTDLIKDVQQGDVLVTLSDVSPALQQVQNVGHGGRRPATSLVVEFVEAFRRIREGVGSSAVLHAVTLLQ